MCRNIVLYIDVCRFTGARPSNGPGLLDILDNDFDAEDMNDALDTFWSENNIQCSA